MDQKIFVVVAAYNEAPVIRQVVGRVRAVCPFVVVVDDGSTDDTFVELRDSGVFLLRHAVNRGQGAALQTGIEFALAYGAEVVVTFDADGQHDENDIPAMVAPILRGECEVTLGSRFLGRTDYIPLVRRMILRLGVVFTRIVSGIRVTDVHNGLRAFSRDAARALRIHLDRMAHASEVLEQVHQAGWKYREIPVRIDYTGYSKGKGQSSANAIRIALQVLREKLVK